ncbi:MAG TPA: hypothetical protein VFI27_03875 [candidate division Zixibacteria bacterium]|nr:hypothetical protein [candidate division Zixibacteria bacterium]
MTEISSEVPLDLPAQYRIFVTGVLDSGWVDRHWGMTSSPVDPRGELEQTVLVGEVVDQAALMGVFNALCNMGHTVVSVERIDPDTDPHSAVTDEEA